MNRDERVLDAAIDAVSKRLVDVPADADLAMRIVQSLPDRHSRARWLVPQLAAASAIVIALVVWNTREQASLPLPVLPSIAVNGFGAPAAIEPLSPGTHANPEPVRTQPLVLVEPVEPLEPPRGDFERALPAVGELSRLEISDIAPGELPAAGALTLPSIDIGVLPLTADALATQK
jgi:hypothetical protein